MSKVLLSGDNSFCCINVHLARRKVLTVSWIDTFGPSVTQALVLFGVGAGNRMKMQHMQEEGGLTK